MNSISELSLGATHPASVKALLDWFVEVYPSRHRVRAATTRARTSAASRLVHALAPLLLKDLTTGRLKAYVNAELQTGRGVCGLRADLATLALAWHEAEAEFGSFPWPSPLFRVVQPRPPAPASPALPTPQQVWRVIDMLDGWPKLATLLLATTGARVIEVAALTWGDFRRRQGRLVLGTPPRRRNIALPLVAAEALWAAGPGRSEVRVFCEVVPTTVASRLRTLVPQACEAAAVPRFTPRALRRAVTSTLLEAGTPVQVVANHLGLCVERAQAHAHHHARRPHYELIARHLSRPSAR